MAFSYLTDAICIGPAMSAGLVIREFIKQTIHHILEPNWYMHFLSPLRYSKIET